MNSEASSTSTSRKRIGWSLGYVVVLALLFLLAGVLGRVVVRAAPVGDDVDLALAGRLVYEALRLLVDLYAFLA